MRGNVFKYQARHETGLGCSREEAWSLLSDLSLAAEYVPGVDKVEMIVDIKGIGASRRVLPAGLVETAADWEEGKSIILDLSRNGKEAFFPFKKARFTYHITEKGENVKMELCLSYDPVMGGFGHLLFKKAIDTRIRKTAESMGGFYNARDFGADNR
jgi:carbon monoxide dehydrogenase subunit G